MQTSIYILILNYKKYQDTTKCLTSLLASDLPKNTRIVVLDNSPDNLSFQYLSKTFPKVKVIKNKKNLGFAGGNNIGIKLALKNKATHVLILNPDTITPKNFLKPLLSHLKDSQSDIIAPALLHYQNGQKFYGLEGNVDPLTGKATHINLPTIKNKNIRSAQFVTFACVLIKAQVFKKTGLLNSKYFMYLEDVDFCLSATRAGFKISLDPSVIVKHNTSSSFKRPTDKLLISFKSQLIFISSWISFPQKIVAYLYTLLFYPYLYLLWTYHFWKHKKI